MPKTIPAAIQTDLDSGQVTLATCIKIVTVACPSGSSSTYGLTEWQENIEYDSVTYRTLGGFTQSEVQSSAQNNVDNSEFTGYFHTTGIDFDDVRHGVFDNAEVTVFQINPESISDGIINEEKGNLGQVSLSDVAFTAEVRGLFQRLQQTIGELISKPCRATFGDSRCKYPTSGDTWQASTSYTASETYDAGVGDFVYPTTTTRFWYRCIQSGTSGGTQPTWPTVIGDTVADGGCIWKCEYRSAAATIVLSPITDGRTFNTGLTLWPDNHFQGGTLTFSSGQNVGFCGEIKSSTSAGVITMQKAFPFVPNIVDAFTVVAGCNKDISDDCLDRWNNTKNFRGEPYTPGQDKVNQTPKVK